MPVGSGTRAIPAHSRFRWFESALLDHFPTPRPPGYRQHSQPVCILRKHGQKVWSLGSIQQD